LKLDPENKSLEELQELKLTRQKELLNLTKAHFDRGQARCAAGIINSIEVIDAHIRKLIELNK